MHILTFTRFCEARVPVFR